MFEKAQTNPQGLFNALLKPETLKMLSGELQQVMIPPLKNALASSLHSVFFVAMIVVFLGVLTSLFVGKTGIESPQEQEKAKKQDSAHSVGEMV